MVDVVTYGAAVAKAKKLIDTAELSPYECKGTCTYAELSTKASTATANKDYWRLSETYTSGSTTYPINSAFLYIGSDTWRLIEMGQELDSANYYTKAQTYSRTEVDTAVAAKSTVSVSATGTATNTVQYITIDNIEYKLAGQGGGGGTTVSGTHDDTNWLTITIGSDTYAIPGGGSSRATRVFIQDTEPDAGLEGAIGDICLCRNNGKVYECTSGTVGAYVWSAMQVPNSSPTAYYTFVRSDKKVSHIASAPTTSTVGEVGELVIVIGTGTLYKCTAITVVEETTTYTWALQSLVLMTSAERTKLSGIESGAEANVIETVKVNGTAQTVTDKAVDIAVPTTYLKSIAVSGSGTSSVITITDQSDNSVIITASEVV